MIKHLIQLLIIILLSSCANRKEDQTYTLTGTITPPDFEGFKVLLQTPNMGLNPEPIDSAIVRNGRFEIRGVAPIEPALILIALIDPETNESHGMETNMILETGDIQLTIDERYYMEVFGTPLNVMGTTCANAIAEYNDTCTAISLMNCTPEHRRQLLEQAQQKRNKTMMDVLLPNINNAVTQNIIYSRYTLFSAEELDIFYRAIENKHNEQAIAFTQSIKEAVIGKKMDETWIPKLDGDSVCLQDIFSRHDYTLVDFWASWCGPCMRNMVNLKELYAHYKGKRFEVVSVSLDNSIEKWRSAAESINGGWIDVSYLTGWDCMLARRLKIDFIPATILFDRNGVIISRNPSFSELDIYLAQ